MGTEEMTCHGDRVKYVFPNGIKNLSLVAPKDGIKQAKNYKLTTCHL